MPIYEFKCKKGHKFDAFLKIADYQTPQTCECGEPSRRIISAPVALIIKKFEAYESPSSGRVISNYQDRLQDMKETGCVEYDPDIKQDHERDRKQADLKIEKAVDETVEQTFEAMPSSKKETLENELKGGFDCEYARSTATN